MDSQQLGIPTSTNIDSQQFGIPTNICFYMIKDNNNLQPGSPGFDSGISGISLDSSDLPTNMDLDRLDGDMEFLKDPFSVESEEQAVGTENSNGSVVDGNYPNFDDMLGGSPHLPVPHHSADLDLSNHFYGDAASDDLIDMFIADQSISTDSISSSFDCGVGKFSISSSDFCTTTTTTTKTATSTTTNKQISNASTSTTTNHFVFSKNNTNQKENMMTPSPLFSDETNNMKNEEDMDDMKQKSRLFRNKKNAEMARANRQKKKDHLQHLEIKMEEVIEERDKLKQENKQFLSIMKHKNREINYLKNILANHSAISQVLEYIPVVKKIHLSSEFSPNDHWSRFSAPNCDQTSYDEYTNNNNHPHTAGMCLHFKPNNHISLEFCAKCSQSSQMTVNQNQDQFYNINEEFSNS